MPTPALHSLPSNVDRAIRTLRELGPAAPLFVVATAGPLLGAAALAATSSHWTGWFAVDAVSIAAFAAAAALAAAACLLPTHATSLAAGYLFGGWLGVAVAWLVVLTAASLAYALLRPMVGERATRALAASPRAAVVHEALLGRSIRRAVWIIALLRLSPVLPFAATNLLLAALGVRAAVFLGATLIGITPRVVGIAWVGSELSELDWTAGGAPWSTVLAIVATVLAVVLIGRTAKAALRREGSSPESR